jgi:hypothetical protein
LLLCISAADISIPAMLSISADTRPSTANGRSDLKSMFTIIHGQDSTGKIKQERNIIEEHS